MKVYKYSLKCEKCGADVSFNIYPIIDIDEKPDLKRKVLNQSVFIAQCRKCQEKIPFPYTTIYSDRKKKLMVSMCCSEEEYMQMASINMSHPMVQTMYANVNKDATFRLVRTPMELKEKIVIKELHYDDRVVEVMKSALIMSLRPVLTDIRSLLLLKDEAEPYILVIKEDYTTARVPFEKKWYEVTASTFSKKVKEIPNDQMVVDQSWVQKCFADTPFDEPSVSISLSK